MPAQCCLSNKTIKEISTYSQNGRKVLAFGITEVIDEYGTRLPDSGLAEIFGLKYSGDVQKQYLYFRLSDAELMKGIPDMPILIHTDYCHIDSK